jgi:hypothetical protein
MVNLDEYVLYDLAGKGGDTIKRIMEESGAKMTMTSKEEAIFTYERVLSIGNLYVYLYVYIDVYVQYTFIYVHICMYI